jgi:hypothetical protein
VDTTADGVADKVKQFSTWLIPIICAAVLFLFFIILTFILGSIVGGVRDSLQS